MVSALISVPARFGCSAAFQLPDDDVDDKPEAIDDDTSDEVKVAEEMVQEPMSNPENFASGSGNRKRARYKTRSSK